MAAPAAAHQLATHMRSWPGGTTRPVLRRAVPLHTTPLPWLQKYVHRVRGLVAEGRREPTGQAAAELDKLMITWVRSSFAPAGGPEAERLLSGHVIWPWSPAAGPIKLVDTAAPRGRALGMQPAGCIGLHMCCDAVRLCSSRACTPPMQLVLSGSAPCLLLVLALCCLPTASQARRSRPVLPHAART